ncbi:hypothetical protein [Foetidibacter luteolus]|uniref:hypothetical protein n=1 Tax=Foetidibacter luteolus TaxID=2608880 RepID=UPI001A999832|nr:hypothetical protein [Foetidibacter luteolus]
MGYIKEPEGVDFIIKSKPLNDKERNAISEFIREYKLKHLQKYPASPRKKIVTRKKILS